MENGSPGGQDVYLDSFLDRVIDFPDGHRYERLEPITDYRRDPGEARILFLCRRIYESEAQTKISDPELRVMKVKIQVPPRPASDDPKDPLPGPSETTAAEWKALQLFSDQQLGGVPWMNAKKCQPQPASGPFPGGYISYTVMDRMPGSDLMALKFWSLDDATKEEIRRAFLRQLKAIWRLGIAPYDCALRNILWDDEEKICSIVDFEHYDPAKDPINMDEQEELQRWGIVHRPPPSHWAVAWGLMKETSTTG